MPRRILHILITIIISLVAAPLFQAAGSLPTNSTAPVEAGGPPLVLAFYYTWFDENSWTPAKVPDFPVQTYVSRDQGTMDRHIAQAQGAGIDAFVVSWYGPWGGVNNQTESNFAAMLDVAAARSFRVGLDVEVTSPFVAGPGSVVEMLQHALRVHAAHPAYLRANGKPVFFFWRQQRFDLATWQWIRNQVDPNHDSIWIAEGIDMSYQSVFDGHHLYSVTWNPPSDVSYTANKFSRWVDNAGQQYGGHRYWVATTMPGYDDTRTGRGNAFIRGRDNGSYYVQTWQAAINSNPDWVIITSWNEWPEGTYIEPSRSYGDLFLHLTAQWTGRFKSGAPSNYDPPPAVAISSSWVAPVLAEPDHAAVRVETAALNVRSGPSIAAEQLAQLPAGRMLPVTARLADDSWWQVCCVNLRYGWVSADYVQPVGPEEKLAEVPVVDITATGAPSWRGLTAD
ncbi:MAG: endo-1,3-alpha-glucanase family glycosylhydrolase [Chloroflexota bacterium]|nr:endo-1,3-alpha-glucanase family glycosylhydrolase [Chloroflexota bacterium]